MRATTKSYPNHRCVHILNYLVEQSVSAEDALFDLRWLVDAYLRIGSNEKHRNGIRDAAMWMHSDINTYMPAIEANNMGFGDWSEWKKENDMV